MVRLLLIALLVVLLVPAVGAQYACPSEDDLRAAESDCNGAGLDHTRYQDARGCTVVRCLEVEVVCPSREQLNKEAELCRQKGSSAVYDIDGNDCQYVRCGSARCPTASDIRGLEEKCKELGRTAETLTDQEGCSFVRCLETECDESQLAGQAQFCVRQGLTARYFVAADGCRAVKCQRPQTGRECLRSMDGDCTIFTCDDGSVFNSCNAPCPALKEPQGEPAREEGYFRRLFRFWGFIK